MDDSSSYSEESDSSTSNSFCDENTFETVISSFSKSKEVPEGIETTTETIPLNKINTPPEELVFSFLNKYADTESTVRTDKSLSTINFEPLIDQTIVSSSAKLIDLQCSDYRLPEVGSIIRESQDSMLNYCCLLNTVNNVHSLKSSAESQSISSTQLSSIIQFSVTGDGVTNKVFERVNSIGLQNPTVLIVPKSTTITDGVGIIAASNNSSTTIHTQIVPDFVEHKMLERNSEQATTLMEENNQVLIRISSKQKYPTSDCQLTALGMICIKHIS